MLRVFAIAIIAAPFLFTAAEVRAGNRSGMVKPGAVTCPAGTCNPKGGPRAKDVRFCTPSNCSRK